MKKERGSGKAAKDRTGPNLTHDRHRFVGVVLSLQGSLTAGGDWFSQSSSQKPLGAETEKQH